MPAEFVLRMFGVFALEGDAGTVVKFPTRRSALLLARLALAKGQTLGREQLTQLLWPEDYHEFARQRFRQELRRLRAAVGPMGAAIQSDRQFVGIAPDTLTTDVGLFDAAFERGEAAGDLERRVAALEDAVKLLNGPLLPGYGEPWVVALRRAYDEKARRAWLALAETYERIGRHPEALNATIQAVHHEPLDLQANTHLVRRLVEQGQVAQARQAFLDFDGALYRELDRHAPASARAALDAASPTESAPERDVVPPPRPAPLFGREALVAELLRRLGQSGARVALVGPIGVGKRHFAAETAWRFFQETGLPVQVGGEPGAVPDGLFVTEPSGDPRTAIAAAARKGWRVLAVANGSLGSESTDEVWVEPLKTPSPAASAAEILGGDAVRLLLSAGASGDPDSAAALGALARALSGLPLALKAFSRRLCIVSANQILDALPEHLEAFVREPKADGASYLEDVARGLDGLTPPVRETFYRLCVLGSATVDLANRLAADADPTAIWSALRSRCLVAPTEAEGVRRLAVLQPLAFAALAGLGEERGRVEAAAWSAVGHWAYPISRQTVGPHLEKAFASLQSELPNLRRALAWSARHDAETAARLAAGTWRTVTARGNPSEDAPLLFKAAQSAANAEPGIRGEAFTGSGIALSIAGRSELAEAAFQRAIETYDAAGYTGGRSWALMNYSGLLLRTDPLRAAELAEKAAADCDWYGVRSVARATRSCALAALGRFDEAIRIAEEIFAQRLEEGDASERARAYTDLGHIYLLAGRVEPARSLIVLGIEKLREVGIQDFLLSALLDFAQITADREERRAILAEASAIADRVGSMLDLLEIARTRATLAFEEEDPAEAARALEEVFRCTQATQSRREREHSLRFLASALRRGGHEPYANAILDALGEPVAGPRHQSWSDLLRSDSHTTVCVLATVMAKEALSLGGAGTMEPGVLRT